MLSRDFENLSALVEKEVGKNMEVRISQYMFGMHAMHGNGRSSPSAAKTSTETTEFQSSHAT
jgi:hypothetical protein